MLSPLEQVEGLISKMKSAVMVRDMASMERFSDELSVLCMAYMEPTIPNPAPGIWLTPNERDILHLLATKASKGASRDAIFTILEYNSRGGAPQMKSADVYVCRLRQKLAAANSDYRIDTVWGWGYRMCEKSAPVPSHYRINGEATSAVSNSNSSLKSKHEQAKG